MFNCVVIIIIFQVKRLLAKPDYRRFSAALVEYKNGKSTAQFQSLSSVLIDLFMADSERFHLFKSEYNFFPSVSAS